MGIVYLPYSIVVAVTAFILCRKTKQPVWWTPACLIFPPALSIPILKSDLKKSGLIIVLLTVSFVAAAGSEAYLYINGHKQAGSSIPPIIRKVMDLNEAVKNSTIEIYKASEKLHSVSMVQSRITDIKSAIETISKMRKLVDKNHKAIETLLNFIDEHQVFFLRKRLEWILSINSFYSNHYVVQHRQSQAQFLAAFENLLTYTYENFQKIMELKSQQQMKSYDVYYLRYRRAADAYNQFNRKRINFEKEFIEKYPEVKPFLPGPHQHEAFRFWDKFQF